MMPDMYMKRFLKVGDASWKIVWQPGSWHTSHGAGADARLVAVRMVPKKEPKLVPEQPMRSGSISAGDQPVHQRLAGGGPIVRAELDAEHRRLVLARPVDRQHGDAAVEPAVAVERHRLP